MPGYETNASLILEGGGMRGLYTAGVLDLFLDEGIYFKKLCAVSAGACHACSYLSRQRDRARRTVMDFLHDPDYATIKSIRETGDLFSKKLVYDEIPNKLLPFDYDTFRKGSFEFDAVVTNIHTGKAEYKRVRDMQTDIEIIRASSSLPYVSQKVEIDGQFYMDGGIADSIPYAYSKSQGNKKHVIILTRHSEYRKTPDRLASTLGRAVYKNYPEFRETMKQRHLNYNKTVFEILLDKLKEEIIVISPRETVKAGRIEKDPRRLQKLYDQGYNDAKEKLPELMDYLRR